MQSPNRSLFLTAGASLVAASLFALLPRPSDAVNTRTFTLDSSADLAAGVLDRVAVTSDGTVVLGADTRRVALDPSAAGVFALLDLGAEGVLAATGVDGRVYLVRDGRATVYAETGAVVVTALAVGEGGAVYAATLPEGRVYRLLAPQNGRPRAPEVLAQLPDTEHVWALAWDRSRRVLLAATGPNGKLFAIEPAGRATVIFDSDEPHLYSLALGPDGTAYAGAGGGHAVLYAVRGPGNARAIARFAGDEVKSISVAGDEVYAAANEFAEPPEAPRRTVSQSRTVTPGGPTASRPRPGRGSVYRVRANGAIERLYNNPDAHVTAIEYAAAEHEVYAALGVNGRVLAIASDRTSRVLFDVDETQVLSLSLAGRTRAFATGDTGAVYLVSGSRAQGGVWTSRVLDATAPARWGTVRARGAGTFTWEARSGNSDPVDNTWSAWSAVDGDFSIRAPAARYLQLRARFSGDAQSVLRTVQVFYLPVNQRAVLTEVTAEAKTGDTRPLAFRVGWRVDNPDNDALRYRVRFRAEAEQRWRTALRGSDYLTATNYDWSVEGLPEGFYRLQIEASDEAANPEAETERDTRTSEPVLIDNTPPRVTLRVAGAAVQGEVADGASSVTRIEWAVDAQEFRPLRAADGVLDERTESFALPPLGLTEAGEHTVSVRAYDEAGNVGTAAVTVRGPGR